MQRILILLLLAVLALAATPGAVERTDMFDDLGDPPAVGDALPFSSDGGIIYNNFGVAGGNAVPAPQLTGISARSGTHKILTQRPARGSIATTGRCLKLKEFYFGLVNANVQGAIGKPLKGFLTLNSFDGKGKQNGQQKVNFTPIDPLLSAPVKVTSTLPPARVVQISASVLDVDGLTPLGEMVTGLYADDFTYTQYGDDAAGVKACGAGF